MDILLNWLWQGGAIALAAAAGLRVIPQSRPQARYAFVWVACAAVLALPAAPHLLTVASPVQAPADPSLAPSIAPDPAVPLPVVWWTSSPLMLALWLTWFAAHAARLAAAVIVVRATKREALDCPPGLEARLPLWSRMKSTGRRTRLVVSSRVRSAAVLGCGEPVIAVAPVVLERLDPADLDRVVLHEWSHVQRSDDRVQLVQQVLHMAVGWHPAIWWLERRLELEREAACDLTAVALTGSAKRYAACLATLAALPVPPVKLSAALAAASPSGLRQRVVRILSHGAGNRPAWRAIAICASLPLMPIALAVGGVQIVEPDLATERLLAPVLPALASTIPVPSSPVGSEPRERPTVSELPPRQLTARAEPARRSSRAPSQPRQERSVAAIEPAIVEPAIVERSVARAAVPPSQPREMPTEELASTLVAAAEPPRQPAAPPLDLPAVDVPTKEPAPDKTTIQTPWAAAAEAGRAIGRGSERAGVKTAGFFSRFGKSIAGSF